MLNLTDRQKQILNLTAEGMTDKEIALVLGIKWNTVKNHQTLLRDHLGAKNRAHAVAMLCSANYRAGGIS